MGWLVGWPGLGVTVPDLLIVSASLEGRDWTGPEALWGFHFLPKGHREGLRQAPRERRRAASLVGTAVPALCGVAADCRTRRLCPPVSHPCCSHVPPGD